MIVPEPVDGLSLVPYGALLLLKSVRNCDGDIHFHRERTQKEDEKDFPPPLKRPPASKPRRDKTARQVGCYFIGGTTEITEGLGLLLRFLTAKKDEMRERKTWVVGFLLRQ